MRLQPTTVDLTGVERAMSLLLSPLDHPSTKSWVRATGEALKDLLGAERALFWLPAAGDDPHLASDDYDTATLDDYVGTYARLDVGLHRRDARRLEVFSRRMLFADDLQSLYRSGCYNEFLKPNEMGDSIGIVDFDDPARPGIFLHRARFGTDAFGEQGVQTLRLLLPAFKAGVAMHARFYRQRAEIGSTLDDLHLPLFLYDLDARPIHHSPELLRLLDDVPVRRQIRDVATALARRVAPLAAGDSDPLAAAAAGPMTDLDTAAGAYRLRASIVAGGLMAREPVVLVVVERRVERRPARAELSARFGLTPRQAEVALLLSGRKSNREIAELLVISPHTVRRHTEAVLLALGLSSRNDVRGHITN